MKRNFLKRLLSRRGYSIVRLNSRSDDMTYPLSRISNDFDLVVDVGVATGTPDLYEGIGGKPLILIEAFPEYYEYLRRKYPNAKLIEECLSDKVEELTFYVRDKHSTSSLNKGNSFSKKFKIKTKTLDMILDGVVDSRENLCLKLDTEGSELKILQGAKKTLNRCRYVISEATFYPSLKGANNYFELVDFMKSNGFKIYDFVNIRKKNNEIDQLDIIFKNMKI